MPKVRKFDTPNEVPQVPARVCASLAASAPVQIGARINAKPGNPRPRRHKQKTYSLLQEDIDRLEALMHEVRAAGLYERSRSDIIRAGILLLESLPLEQKLEAVNAVEDLKG